MIRSALIAFMVVALAFGLAARGAVGVSDYIAQGTLLALVLVVPFTMPLEFSLAKEMGLLFAVYLVWGAWRLLYFDIVTGNGIPGAGYLIVAWLPCAVAAILFSVRKWWSTRSQT